MLSIIRKVLAAVKRMFRHTDSISLRNERSIHLPHRAPSSEVIKRFVQQFKGEVITPEDPRYNQDRQLSNPLFQHFPLMIVFCQTESDVDICLLLVRNIS
jgi:hypothetical protein